MGGNERPQEIHVARYGDDVVCTKSAGRYRVFEMPVVDAMERLVYQAAGCVLSATFADRWSQWSHYRICYYDQLDTVPAERVLGSIYWVGLHWYAQRGWNKDQHGRWAVRWITLW